MEQNLRKIKKIAQNKDEENWKFRCFLKCCDLDTEEIDAVVHRLLDEVQAEIDCKSCANCCKEMRPILVRQDVDNLCTWLHMEEQDFRRQYLTVENDETFFNKMPCPFLKDNMCSCYDCRPQDCASYPHLHKEGFISRLYGVLDNIPICPIVFNVYERLKQEIWH